MSRSASMHIYTRLAATHLGGTNIKVVNSSAVETMVAVRVSVIPAQQQRSSGTGRGEFVRQIDANCLRIR